MGILLEGCCNAAGWVRPSPATTCRRALRPGVPGRRREGGGTAARHGGWGRRTGGTGGSAVPGRFRRHGSAGRRPAGTTNPLIRLDQASSVATLLATDFAAAQTCVPPEQSGVATAPPTFPPAAGGAPVAIGRDHPKPGGG